MSNEVLPSAKPRWMSSINWKLWKSTRDGRSAFVHVIGMFFVF